MKYLKALIVTLAALTMIFPLSACDSAKESEAIPGITEARAECVKMINHVPVFDKYLEFWDVKTLRNDSSLSEMYEVWQESHDIHELFCINQEDISYLTQADFTLVSGSFRADDIKRNYNVNYQRDSGYKNADVWEFRKGEPPNPIISWSISVSDDILCLGNRQNIGNFVDVSKGKELSMYDKNAAAVLERLPEAVNVKIERGENPAGLILSGSSVSKDQDGYMKWTNVYKFESTEVAASQEVDDYFINLEDEYNEAISQFTDRYDTSPLKDLKIERDGEFVTWSMLVELKFMIGMLFYG